MKLLQDLGVNLTVASSSGRSKCLSPSLIFGEMWMFNAVEFSILLCTSLCFYFLINGSKKYKLQIRKSVKNKGKDRFEDIECIVKCV